MSLPKVKLPGTHRAVRPEVTWARIEPQLGRFGITRVADVTRLDNIGIPVVLAVRPLSETLAVSQGKGVSVTLARLSAVMESIELWHAERPAVEDFVAAAADLDLPYALSDLNLRGPVSSWADGLELSWVWAAPIAGGARVPVPLDLVRLSYSGEHFWRPRVFQTSSTGLASGNTFAEACLHAVYEAVERDVLAGAPDRDDARRLRLDPTSFRSGHLRALLARLDEAGVEYEIEYLPNRFGIPTFAAYVWSPLFPIVCAGSGSHMDADVALSRALTEAVQSRLTEISATRDDIPSELDLARDGCVAPGFRAHSDGLPLEDALRGDGEDFDDLELELAAVTRRVSDAVGHQPLAVELSTQPELFSVVRVVCPGLSYSQGRTLPT